MSWFGEHLTSFTEKISDLTKEILPDSGISPSDDPAPEENISHSPKHLLDLCKEKDAEIGVLMNEKASLERSIEELDTQHQEAIGELLHLKNEAVKESIALKKELAFQKENASVKSLFKNFEHNYCPRELSNDGNQFVTEDMLSNSLKKINLINIIGVLWKSFNDVSMNSILKWLEEQKILLETQSISVGDSSFRDVINRLNTYIEFFQLVSSNPILFSHIIDEIATVIHFLLSNHARENSIISVPECINGQLTDNSLPRVETESNDFSSQTLIPDFEHIRELFFSNPRPFFCNSALAAINNPETSSVSQHVQTDHEHSVQNCNSLISELTQYIVHLEQEKDELQLAAVELEERVSHLQERLNASISTSSVFVQTENIQNESNSHISLTSSTMQTDIFDCNCNNSKLKELQAYVDALEEEKTEFQNKIKELHSINNRSTSSSLTQTDVYVCGCNVHELEAGICILEQDKADLEEELSYLKSQIEKPVSSVLIQTEEGSNCYDLLQSEISNLKQILNFNEKEYNDTIEELNENLNVLEEKLKANESIICDKENKLQSLELECTEYRQSINSLTAEIGDINKLKADMLRNENCIKEKENIIYSLECELDECKAIVGDLNVKAQQVDDLINLKDELEIKDSVLQDKENVIQLLQHEIGEYKSAVNNLQEKLHEVSDVGNLKEEVKLKECVIQEKENMVHSLEKDLEVYKTSIDNLKMQQIDEIENLQKKIKI